MNAHSQRREARGGSHRPRSLNQTRSLSLLFLGLGLGAPSVAFAQPVDPAADQPAAAEPAVEPASKQPTAEQLTENADLLAETLKPQRGGATARSIGKRAKAHSPAVKAQEAKIKASAAQVDQAMTAFLPQLTLKASYTRISKTDTSFGGGAIVGASAPGLLNVGACPSGAGTCVLDSAGNPAGAAAFNITPKLDRYSLSATLSVPISDYLLRLPASSAAVKANLEASRINKQATERKAQADAQLAYYNWVRGVGQVAVAEHALVRLEQLQKDGEAMLAQGVATKADVLRIKAMVASGKVAIEQARAFVRLSEKNLALMTGDKTPHYTIGEDILRLPRPLPRSTSLKGLVNEGLSKRPELRALTKSKVALRKSASVARAGKLPRLDGFADYTYANPSASDFTGQGGWQGSWSLGAQLTWTLNDLPGAEATASEYDANLEEVNANESLLRQGIEQEITAAYFDRKQARAARQAAEEAEEAARIALNAKMAQYKVGEATATDVINAEQEFVSAALQRMAAYVDLHVARVRLAYAVGRPAL
ncbi:MAG: TolC family protein [Myxococcales bacterium]|nr:TolC family protein [Myxococcales bacterium]